MFTIVLPLCLLSSSAFGQAAGDDVNAELAKAIREQMKINASLREAAARNLSDRTLSDELAKARRDGWGWVGVLIPIISTDDDSFPAMSRFRRQLESAFKTIDRELPCQDWAVVNADELTRDNPDFWAAYYEVAPGGGVMELIYAAVLQGCGECTRAYHITALNRRLRLMPAMLQQINHSMLARCNGVIQAAYAEIHKGIQQYDAGEYEVAEKIFNDVLRRWPQASLAHYELGLTRYARDELAAGRKPQELGTIQRQSDGDVHLPSPAVYAHYQQARQYDPFQANAYQGPDQEDQKRLFVMFRGVIPAWQHIAEFRRKEIDDGALKVFMTGAQKAGLHDYALLAKTIEIARRKPLRFAPGDHSFISESLQALVPGDEATATLQILAGERVKLFDVNRIDVLHHKPGSPVNSDSRRQAQESR